LIGARFVQGFNLTQQGCESVRTRSHLVQDWSGGFAPGPPAGSLARASPARSVRQARSLRSLGAGVRRFPDPTPSLAALGPRSTEIDIAW